MDKAQKELVKSYYHARNIAGKENHLYLAKDYEITEFGIKNNLIDFSLEGNINFFIENPELIPYVEDKLESLSEFGKDRVMYKQPLFIDYFLKKKEILGFNNWLTIFIIKPEYINKYQELLRFVNIHQIANTLSKQPKLIDYVKNRLNEFNPDDIGLVLSWQPQLIEYFKDRLNELGSDSVFYILSKPNSSGLHHELVNYFLDVLNDTNRNDMHEFDKIISAIIVSRPNSIKLFKPWRLFVLGYDYEKYIKQKIPEYSNYIDKVELINKYKDDPEFKKNIDKNVK